MHREGGHADVHLLTDVALLGIVRVKAPVSLPVSGQVAAGCIMFSTVTAGNLDFRGWPGGLGGASWYSRLCEVGRRLGLGGGVQSQGLI